MYDASHIKQDSTIKLKVMKKWMITTALALTTVFALAQEEVPEPPAPEQPKSKTGDTTRIKIGGKEMVLVNDGDDMNVYQTADTTKVKKSSNVTVSVFGTGRNRVFQGIEFGFSGFSYSEDFNTDVPNGMDAWEVDVPNSINWAINPFEVDVRIINEYVKFSTGLGYNVRNFSLRNNYDIYKDGAGDTIAWSPSANDLEKNRFRVGYLTIPAMLHFNTSKNAEKSFRIGAGVQGGMRLFQTYRWKYFEDGQKHKGNVNKSWETNFLTLDARAIVGYGGINLYATYALTPLFDTNHGPELYPFTIGITFVNVWD